MSNKTSLVLRGPRKPCFVFCLCRASYISTHPSRRIIDNPEYHPWMFPHKPCAGIARRGEPNRDEKFMGRVQNHKPVFSAIKLFWMNMSLRIFVMEGVHPYANLPALWFTFPRFFCQVMRKSFGKFVNINIILIFRTSSGFRVDLYSVLLTSRRQLPRKYVTKPCVTVYLMYFLLFYLRRSRQSNEWIIHARRRRLIWTFGSWVSMESEVWFDLWFCSKADMTVLKIIELHISP